MSLQAVLIAQALARPDVRRLLQWAALQAAREPWLGQRTEPDDTDRAALQLLQDAGFLPTDTAPGGSRQHLEQAP